jgi:hypothetical protein
MITGMRWMVLGAGDKRSELISVLVMG